MLSRLFSLFTFVNSQRQREEDWLAQSTDLVELERRQRQLTYGQAKINLH